MGRRRVPSDQKKHKAHIGNCQLQQWALDAYQAEADLTGATIKSLYEDALTRDARRLTKKHAVARTQ